MKKNEMITSENEVVKEYQIPELFDLNGINETQAFPPICSNGSGDVGACSSGASGPVPG
jgi:hypothetical protein